MYTTQNKTRLVPHPTFEDVVAQSRFFCTKFAKMKLFMVNIYVKWGFWALKQLSHNTCKEENSD